MLQHVVNTRTGVIYSLAAINLRAAVMKRKISKLCILHFLTLRIIPYVLIHIIPHYMGARGAAVGRCTALQV
jgi:hypothetical protein